MTLPRVLLAVLVLTLLLTIGATVTSLVDQAPRPRLAVTSPSPGEPSGEPDALSILHAWDERRARAWSTGDVTALRDLYVAESVAGGRDVTMLRAWRRRGLRVEDLGTQVLDARVVTRSDARLVLVVTDRLVGGMAVGRHVRADLPRDLPTTRRIVLRHVHGAWRVAQVRAAARRPGT